MHVELLYYTPDPERAIATAARLCYAPVGAAELMETMPEERIRSVLTTIMESGHFSTRATPSPSTASPARSPISSCVTASRASTSKVSAT